ncbi:hypothetical protein KGM_214270 [Danaus plexippus plexippus]|uniref:Uncharacterized protein n=1 Tax=Danaus plexippus plexippus TaxID=278856 RepID=A0A212FDN5_DANPL|nr:hypothetical protein KGM_214270 [Danaus plexippus plexippus]
MDQYTDAKVFSTVIFDNDWDKQEEEVKVDTELIKFYWHLDTDFDRGDSIGVQSSRSPAECLRPRSANSSMVVQKELSDAFDDVRCIFAIDYACCFKRGLKCNDSAHCRYEPTPLEASPTPHVSHANINLTPENHRS